MRLGFEPGSRHYGSVTRLDPQFGNRDLRRRGRMTTIKRQFVTKPPQSDRDCQSDESESEGAKYLLPRGLLALCQRFLPKDALSRLAGGCREWVLG